MHRANRQFHVDDAVHFLMCCSDFNLFDLHNKLLRQPCDVLAAVVQLSVIELEPCMHVGLFKLMRRYKRRLGKT